MPVIHNPQTHLDSWLQLAIVRVAAYLAGVGGENILEHYGFLNSYLAMARQHVPPATSLLELDSAWRDVVREQEARVGRQAADFPLVRLRQAGLADDHLAALVLAGLVENDARFGTLYSALHPFPDESRLTVGLLNDLLRFNSPDEVTPGWRLAADLDRLGLATLHYPNRPRAAQALSVPALVWDALAGEPFVQPAPFCIYRSQAEFAPLANLTGLLPASLLDRLGRLPALVAGGLARGVIVRGMRGSGRLRALGAVARALGRDVLHISRPDAPELAGLGHLAGALTLLRPVVPVIELELGPGETVALPGLAGYPGLFGFILGPEGSVTGPAAESCVTLQVPAPGQAARQQQWSQVLAGGSNGTQAVIDTISRSYHLTLGGVEQAGRLAQAYAALNGHSHVEVTDVQEACRTLNQQSIENLASRMLAAGDWNDLIVAESTRAELDGLILRCRHRETVLSRLGRGFAGTTRGVRALFSGPSGTGKTLAARIAAAELGLDLYRVDLSAVVSKYIGETERNLSRLFARAEEQDIILLLDEGDSLLTARTDVRNSNDRYANMETNYLLQRLEHYEGIILISTNAPHRVDSAFRRRIDIFVDFNLPDAGQRQRLWYLHIPEQHEVSQNFIRTASLRCQLTGGQIRNAALHAAVLAVEANRLLDDAFLAEGIRREYTKMGAASPLN